MIILGIETSCDETALSIIETFPNMSDVSGTPSSALSRVRIMSDVLISQTKIHEQYGGVFPMLAKREHAKNLTPLLHKALVEAGTYTEAHASLEAPMRALITSALEKENDLADVLISFLETTTRPYIDAIAVTSGPGLEPALWVGISFAKALGLAWDIPVFPVNHMEGHIAASLIQESGELRALAFPSLAILLSGGHTELVLIKAWREYHIIGSTLDDAVGEAFDKAARLLGLPYPGGPEIARLAAEDRIAHPVPVSTTDAHFKLPRPMLSGEHADTLDMSFSGIKTAVRYMLAGGQQKMSEQAVETRAKDGTVSADDKKHIAREFEDAVTEVLIAKATSALDQHDIQTLILGGGVTANTFIRNAFARLAQQRGIELLLPRAGLSTDNALMIAIAGAFDATTASSTQKISGNSSNTIRAEGNLSL